MVAFDVCGKRRVATSTTVRTRFRSDQFEDFGRVTREELGVALQKQREKRENAFSGKLRQVEVVAENENMESCRHANEC